MRDIVFGVAQVYCAHVPAFLTRGSAFVERQDNGTSVVEVTEPRSPKLLAHIPGEPGAGAQMVRVCDGATLPRADRRRVYLLRTRGSSAHEIWDVTDPARPSFVVTVAANLSGTHKNWWECDTGIAYLVSGVPGWRTRRMTQVFDLSDPARPRFIRDFGLPGQQPGATGPVDTGLHGAISAGPARNRIYFGYGTNADGVLQIVDRRKLLEGPREPTAANLMHPQVGRLDLPPTLGAHTTFPILDVDVAEFARDGVGSRRDFVLIVNEALTSPTEVAYFIPAGNPLTNNVEVDGRGYVYIVDRGTLGMHIVALTGEARKIANWR